MLLSICDCINILRLMDLLIMLFCFFKKSQVTERHKGMVILPELLSHLQQPNSCLEVWLDEACMPLNLDLQPNGQANIKAVIQVTLTNLIQCWHTKYFDFIFLSFKLNCNTSIDLFYASNAKVSGVLILITYMTNCSFYCLLSQHWKGPTC